MSEAFTNYTVNYPHQAAWIVYMNGLEVPVSSVFCDFGVNKIPSCTIDMPPDPRLTRLGFEDRIEVDVFYLDEFHNPDNPEFCLMGEFDIMGWAYSNSGSGRSLRFMCVGTVQIFQQLNMFYMSAVDDIVNAYLPATDTSATTVTPMVYFPASLFLQGIMPRLTAEKDVEGDTEVVTRTDFIKTPYQFIRNIFKSMLGKVDVGNADVNATSDPANMVPQSATSAPGRNFFARYMKRRDIYRRFVGLPFIDRDMQNPVDGCFPLIKAVQGTEVLNAIQSQLGASIGSAGTIWELLRSVLGTMYMEVVSIPAPTIAMAEKETGVMVDLFKGERNSGDLMGVIASNFIKPQCFFGLPPTCNIIFPSMVESLHIEENYTNQPTRVYLGEQFLSNILAAKASGSAAQLVTSTLTTGYPPVVKSRMKQYMLDAKQNTKNFLIWPEEFFRGPVVKQAAAPPWLWMLDKFRAAIEGTYGTGTGTGGGGAGWQSMGARKMRKFIEPYIQEAVSNWQVDRYWILSTIAKESGFHVHDGRIPSPKGQISRGLMQVNTDLFYNMIKLLRKEGKIPKDMTDEQISYNDPKWNIFAGVRYARQVMNICKLNPKNVNRQNLFFDPTKPINDMHVFIVGYGGGIGKGKWMKKQMDAGKKLGDLRRTAVSRPGNEGWQNFLERATARMAKAWDAIKADDLQMQASEDPAQDLKDVAGGDLLAEEYAAGNPDVGSSQMTPDPTENKEKPKQIPDPAQSQNKSESSQTTSQTSSSSQGDFYDPSKKPQQPQSIPDAPPEQSQVVDTTIAGMSQMEQDGLGQLFDYYAQYEYFRSRYENRIGGATLAFNPYIVPAFPAVLFDSKYSGVSTIGYIMNVTHQMSANANACMMSTTVNTAFQRTLPEFLGDMRTGWDAAFWADRPFPYTCFPIDPIPDVAAIFQQLSMANLFYAKFFHRAALDVPIPENKMEEEAKAQAEEDWATESSEAENAIADENKKAMAEAAGTTYQDSAVMDAEQRKEKLKSYKGPAFVFNLHQMISIVKKNPEGRVVEEDVPFWEFTEDMEIKPNPRYRELFRSYDAAMGYVSRPVCTLREYIALKHGMSVAAAIEAGFVTGEERSFYSHLLNSQGIKKLKKGGNTAQGGAVFWARIFTLHQGPGSQSGDIQTIIQKYSNIGPAEENYPPMDPWYMIDRANNLPQTRQDWDSILLSYRNTVRAQGGDKGVPRR